MSLLNPQRVMNINDLKELNTRMMRTCLELESTIIRHRSRPAIYWIEFVIFIMLMSILLATVLSMTLLWPMYFRDGLSLLDEEYKEFNIHPPLMIGSFITLNGFGICAYRFLRCMHHDRITIVHMVFEFCVIGFAAMGVLAVLHSYLRASKPKKQFESMHSQMGMTTIIFHIGHYIIACIVLTVYRIFKKKYFKSRLFREGTVLLHAGIGLSNFLMAVATSFTGFIEHEKQIQAPRVYSYVNDTVTEHRVLSAICILLFILPIVAVFVLRRVHSSVNRNG